MPAMYLKGLGARLIISMSTRRQESQSPQGWGDSKGDIKNARLCVKRRITSIPGSPSEPQPPDFFFFIPSLSSRPSSTLTSASASSAEKFPNRGAHTSRSSRLIDAAR